MASIQKLIIDQQIAEIGVNSTPARMNITSPRMQMKITSEHPRMEIDRKAPTFKVNRKKINSESGLKGPIELSKAYRDEGVSKALKGAKTAAADGNFLGNVKIRGNRLAKLSRNKAMNAAMKKRHVELGLMPQKSPEVEWDTGYMHINWSKHSIVIDWDGEFMPELKVDPKYSVEVFMRTEPHFRVSVADLIDPNSTGRYVDQAI